jgi:hypothetical protein
VRNLYALLSGFATLDQDEQRSQALLIDLGYGQSTTPLFDRLRDCAQSFRELRCAAAESTNWDPPTWSKDGPEPNHQVFDLANAMFTALSASQTCQKCQATSLALATHRRLSATTWNIEFGMLFCATPLQQWQEAVVDVTNQK